jgi:uncharacterized membrane protein HdeD (DUF308 family)
MLLARNWWAFLLRGILAVIFGLVALFYPASAFLSLVLVFGAFALVNGVFAIVSAFTGGVHSENWWWIILEGAFGILIGVLTVMQPLAMGLAWVLVIAAWAIVTGVFEIISAIRLRKMITGEWAMILSGVLSVLFGAILAFYPRAGALAVGFIFGIYALIYGVMYLVLGWHLRSHVATRAAAV